ncbi:hypothetical protein CGJ22_23505 [Vibrio parahaemolyticus]|nr:hypothetical protein [Vibrio parahaemolyticus]QLE27479.1 hypothetical protein FDP11_18510 [Vibrio parahaemolyticus]TBT50698.1 hypothetical protein D5E76_25580 [Vibrio parahaemolyticus]TOF46638.1 hypothetical protein CGJ22_23505 [Vibrio parahaemolyticus]TOI83556.1 hypothetical protein CGI51_24640 [Vibrio parahaemolyticus]
MNNSDKETLVLPKFSLRQRNHAREFARKLETVNGKIKTKTSHLVPPERTLKAHLIRCKTRKRNQ